MEDKIKISQAPQKMQNTQKLPGFQQNQIRNQEKQIIPKNQQIPEQDCKAHPCRVRYFCLDDNCPAESRGLCGECVIEGWHLFFDKFS